MIGIHNLFNIIRILQIQLIHVKSLHYPNKLLFFKLLINKNILNLAEKLDISKNNVQYIINSYNGTYPLTV